ncbi:MAG: tetratricopeptide repeat protein [Candidatus Heimdallarchaeota archaeon]|nr:tetratricopeptide repeat protein [Candidatus Heimdallarchaeota archaeon]MCK4289530.1 tetratricopeptide repeat protein [Candidatus Heimdallarchaeota archaeon]
MSKSENIKKLLEDGLEALRKNKNEKAIEYFDRVIAVESENTMAWNNKGVALRKLGKIEDALNCYNKALSIDPDLSRALLNKARALKMQKKFDLALFTYEDILELHPEHPVAAEESERVRNLLSRQVQLTQVEVSITKKESEERKLFQERNEELIEFLEESRKSISDSVEKIEEIFTSGIKAEALEPRDRILKALISFNEQLLNRIRNINDEFVTLDFEEEIRELIDTWDAFKDAKIEELKSLN